MERERVSHPLEPEAERDPEGAGPGPVEKRFRLWYVGSACLDGRTTLPMLPWLVAEIRRRSQRREPSVVPAREVLLLLGAPALRCVPAGAAPAVLIFEHRPQHIARFVHSSHDLTCFAYLIKAQPGDPESPMVCHVFRAADPGQLMNLCEKEVLFSSHHLLNDVTFCVMMSLPAFRRHHEC